LVNYKQTFYDTIAIGELTKTLLPGEVWKRLTMSGANAIPISLHETFLADDYQVPSGKKARIFFLRNVTTAHASHQLIYSDTAQASDNPVVIIEPPASTLTNFYYTVSNSIPAGKWIVAQSTVGTSHTWNVDIIEEDA